MKRVRKGFSRAVTPLFPTMMVQAQEEMGEGSANPTNPHYTPIITQPSTSLPQKKQKPRKPKRKGTEIPQSSGPTEPIADEASNEENVPTHYNDPLLNGDFKFEVKSQEVRKERRVKNSQAQKTIQIWLASKQERKIDDIDQDAEVTLVDETQGSYKMKIKNQKQVKNLQERRLEKVEEANISWDNVQAMIEADRLLAERLQAREQEELTDEEKARLFVELLEKRKKHFAALRAQEKRNKPPTKA
ncbi:hypothetical protein Tco_1164734 [Tanacetum coccineum]